MFRRTYQTTTQQDQDALGKCLAKPGPARVSEAAIAICESSQQHFRNFPKKISVDAGRLATSFSTLTDTINRQAGVVVLFATGTLYTEPFLIEDLENAFPETDWLLSVYPVSVPDTDFLYDFGERSAIRVRSSIRGTRWTKTGTQ